LLYCLFAFNLSQLSLSGKFSAAKERSFDFSRLILIIWRRADSDLKNIAFYAIITLSVSDTEDEVRTVILVFLWRCWQDLKIQSF